MAEQASSTTPTTPIATTLSQPAPPSGTSTSPTAASSPGKIKFKVKLSRPVLATDAPSTDIAASAGALVGRKRGRTDSDYVDDTNTPPSPTRRRIDSASAGATAGSDDSVRRSGRARKVKNSDDFVVEIEPRKHKKTDDNKTTTPLVTATAAAAAAAKKPTTRTPTSAGNSSLSRVVATTPVSGVASPASSRSSLSSKSGAGKAKKVAPAIRRVRKTAGARRTQSNTDSDVASILGSDTDDDTLGGDSELDDLDDSELNIDDDDDDDDALVDDSELDDGGSESSRSLSTRRGDPFDSNSSDSDLDDELDDDLDDELNEDDDVEEDDVEEEDEEEDEGSDDSNGDRDAQNQKLTQRQRAMIGQDELGGALMSLPMGRRTKKHLTHEDLVRRSELARRRKRMTEKQAENEKRQVIERLLMRTKASRAKKEEKQKKAEFQPIDRAPKPIVNPVVLVLGPEGQSALHLPVELADDCRYLPQRAPLVMPQRSRARCAAGGCSLPQRYTTSSNGLPVCSLACYKRLYDESNHSSSSSLSMMTVE